MEQVRTVGLREVFRKRERNFLGLRLYSHGKIIIIGLKVVLLLK